MRRLPPVFLLLLLAGCATTALPPAPPPPPPAAPSPAPPAPPPSEPAASSAAIPVTQVLDREAADRLLAAKGITLQWIGWDRRGTIHVVEKHGTISLTAAQDQPDGHGRLFVQGTVREVGREYFILDGTIRIADTPEAGRVCEADKLWHFAITQNRPYWRLREFEWCDGYTDYVDIYF